MQPPQGFPPQGYENNQQPQWTRVPPAYQDMEQPYPPQQPMTQMPPAAQIRPDAQQGYSMFPQPQDMGEASFSYPQMGAAPAPDDEAAAGRPAPPPATAQALQAAYQTPKTGLPRARQRRSKKGIYIALLAVVILSVAVIGLRLLTPGQARYGYAAQGALSSLYTGDAIVVRNETVFTQDGVSQIEYKADEGSEVLRGQEVASVFSSGFSAKEWTNLSHYRTQIKEYHKTLILNAASDSKLITYLTAIKERTLEAQHLVQGIPGSLAVQERLLKSAMQDMQIYLRQKYPDDQKLTRLYDDENTQLHRIESWMKQYAAPSDGLVSFYTDGYESALNMENYGGFTPAQIRQMYNGQIPEDGHPLSRNTVSIYRVVRKQPWMVMMLCNEKEWTPVQGRTYQLRIESFDNVTVSAIVESFTRSGGELLVRLRVEDADKLQNVLYIRACNVYLGESVNSLMVPSRAIYLREGQKGVVVTADGGEYWTGVEVISDDGQNAYIIPENPYVVYEGVRVRLF